jgi:hypothetical protein
MRFKVDENLPVEVAQLFREAGHEATTVRDQQIGGSGDAMVASICQQETRVLVTLELDFADIRTYPPAHYAGVIVLRLWRQDKPHVIVDTVYLGCWSRDVFGRIGTFDEELVRSQDDEFNLRLTRCGGKIWQSPRIRSWYQPRGSLLALFRQYMQYGYWKVRVIQKHKMPASIRHLIPGGFVFLLIMLPLASLWSSFAAWLWLELVGTYAICNIAFSLATAASHGWRLFPLLPAVFACYHLGYGYGFLHGVWDFVIVRRGPHHAFSKLSRASNSL